jgi:hypothetical protein
MNIRKIQTITHPMPRPQNRGQLGCKPLGSPSFRSCVEPGLNGVLWVRRARVM